MLAVELLISPSSEVVCAVPFLDVRLVAGIGTGTWFSQLSVEFHTYITPILNSQDKSIRAELY